MFGWFKSALLGLITALVLSYGVVMSLASKPFELQLPLAFLTKSLIFGGLLGLALALFFHWMIVRKTSAL